MIRSLLILAVAGVLAGCAHRRAHEPAAHMPLPIMDDNAVAAGALVFDPPGAVELPPIVLAREPRQPVAVVGYEDVVTTLFYLRMDDRQFILDRDQWTIRRAITTRLGVSYR